MGPMGHSRMTGAVQVGCVLGGSDLRGMAFVMVRRRATCKPLATGVDGGAILRSDTTAEAGDTTAS